MILIDVYEVGSTKVSLQRRVEVRSSAAIGLMNFNNTATVELLMAHNLLSSYIITGKLAAVSESWAKEAFYLTEAKVAFVALLASNGQIPQQILANKANVLMGYNMIFPSLPKFVSAAALATQGYITHLESLFMEDQDLDCVSAPLGTWPTLSSVSVKMFNAGRRLPAWGGGGEVTRPWTSCRGVGRPWASTSVLGSSVAPPTISGLMMVVSQDICTEMPRPRGELG